MSTTEIQELLVKAKGPLFRKGDATAQYNLALLYANGKGVEKDNNKAFEWFEKAAKQGHPGAQCKLGDEYFSRDKAEAYKWYRKAADQGDSKAKYRLGSIYYWFGQGGVALNKKAAIELIQQAAELGYAEAQFRLGALYVNGEEVKQDYEKAHEWYQKAAEQGHEKARIEVDLITKILTWLKEANAGNLDAQYNLGFAYDEGKGVEKDYKKASEWYQKAAVLRHAQAQFRLGLAFRYGHGLPEDSTKSFEWVNKAAQQGHADAQYTLGEWYERGYVPDGKKDLTTAIRWYLKARAQGHKGAEATLARGSKTPSTRTDGWAPIENVGNTLEQLIFAMEVQKAAMEEYYDMNPAARPPKSSTGTSTVPSTTSQNLSLSNSSPVSQSGTVLQKKGDPSSELNNIEKEKKIQIEQIKTEQKRVQESLTIAGVSPEQNKGLEIKAQSEAVKNISESTTPNNAVTTNENKNSKDTPQKPNSFQTSQVPKQPPSPKPTLLPAVPRVAWSALTEEELVGNGSYGDVYKGKWQGVTVAIKKLQSKTLSPPMIKEFERETDIMMQCHFPFIVHLYSVCTEPGHFAMVMEYLPTSLRSRLQDEKPLSWLKRLTLALEMAQGIAYLHSRNILHRDLKSYNILLDNEEHVRIADFGLAKVKLEIGSTSTKSHKATGSIRWRAPELFDFPPPKDNPAADIYSLGMLFWELASRELPYRYSADEIIVRGWIKEGKKEKIPENCPKLFAEIIQDCWATFEKRPSALDIVSRLTIALKAEEETFNQSSVKALERLKILYQSLEPYQNQEKITQLNLETSIKAYEEIKNNIQRCLEKLAELNYPQEQINQYIKERDLKLSAVEYTFGLICNKMTASSDKAYFWFTEAAARGHSGAQSMLPAISNAQGIQNLLKMSEKSLSVAEKSLSVSGKALLISEETYGVITLPPVSPMLDDFPLSPNSITTTPQSGSTLLLSDDAQIAAGFKTALENASSANAHQTGMQPLNSWI